MTAYESARYHDYIERSQKSIPDLTPQEQRDFNSLDVIARKVWESESQPWLYGGDMEDAF